MSSFPETDLNKVKRIPNRGSYNKKTVYGILDSHFICHVSYTYNGVSMCIPTSYGRKGDTIYLHGAVKNRMMNSLIDCDKVSLTVTHLDGLVLARSVFHHSMNYRSALVFGKPRIVDEGEEKLEALRIITENIIPNRWDESRGPNENELKATMVVAIDVTEASAKIRTGPPQDNKEDYDLDVWAGVIPMKIATDTPIDDDQLQEGISISHSAKNYQFV